MDEDESAATIIAVEQAWKAARQSQDRSAEGKALLQLSEARLALKEVDHALKEANLAVSIFQEIRDRVSEAAAQLCVCNSHLGRIALDAQKSRFPATTNTMGALRASKAAYKIYDELADTTGKERSSRALSNALVVSGVPANTVPRPEALVQTQDLAGAVRDCGGHYSPFHEGPQLKVRHKPVESAGPEKKAIFERTSFKWNDPTKEFCYSLIWEPYKKGNVASKTRKYNASAVSMGARSAALPLYHSLKPQDPAQNASSGPLCVHINAYDASTNYGSSLMAALHTVSSMVTAKLKRLTFVQVGEAPLEGNDAAKNAARQVALTPCMLALIRSARIEAPQLAIGFVSGDAASWMTERDALVSAIFDSIDEEETELMWSRRQAMMPTLIQKQLPEPLTRKAKAPHDT